MRDWEEYMGHMYLQQPFGRDLEVYYRVEEVIARKKSKYQDILIVRLAVFGKTLVLDGLIQSTEVDEHVYHEALVQPAMHLHPCPRRVLILGGGEGATLREALKHNCVQEAVMVDIDADVVEMARKYLPEWHQGAFEDPRSKIVIGDAAEYVENALRKEEKFSVVVMDLTDPYGPDIARHIYNEEFLSKIKGVLEEPGILVTQAGNSFFYSKAYQPLVAVFRKVFPEVREYSAWIPSFLYTNNYIIAANTPGVLDASGEEIEKRSKERGVRNRFYSPKTHIAMFNYPATLS